MAASRASTGRFIVLEGPDGSGTTTHASLLAQALRSDGAVVLLTAEPTDGPVGTTIRTLLRSGETLPADALQLLFTADRADHVATTIAPALARGETVLCDRYALSTIAYGEAFGVDGAWLESVNTKFVQPDLQLLLLPPMETCLERLRSRQATDMLEREDVQRRVHAAYAAYAATHASIRVIDSSPPTAAVAAALLAHVRGGA